MTFFLLVTCYKGQEHGHSEGMAVQGAQQRHEQGSSPRRVTDDGEDLGGCCLEVMGIHRKMHLPRGPGEVESLDRGAAFESACSGSCEPACTDSLVSSQKEAPGQLLGIPNGMVLFVRELCPLVSAEALNCFSSSVSPDQGFINTHLPLLLCHPRLEVMCANAWHVNVSPGSALLAGA